MLCPAMCVKKQNTKLKLLRIVSGCKYTGRKPISTDWTNEKSPQKHLQSVSEGLRSVFSFSSVSADCGMLQNANFDLCGTICICANSL